MPGTDEGSERLPLRRDEWFVEGDALVARQHGLADANNAVAVAHWSRNVGNLIAMWLPLLGRSSQALECFKKKRFNVVWLEAPCFRSLHFFTDAVHAARVHRVVRECPLFD